MVRAATGDRHAAPRGPLRTECVKLDLGLPVFISMVFPNDLFDTDKYRMNRTCIPIETVSLSIINLLLQLQEQPP